MYPSRQARRTTEPWEARRLNRLAARCQASAADSAPGGARARVAGPSRRQGRQHPGPAGAVLGEAVEQHDPAHRLAGQRRGRQDQPMGGEPERFHPGAWVAVAVSQGAASPGPHRQYTARAQQGWSLLTNRPRPECRKQPPSCDLRFTRFPEPGARPDDPPRGRPRCDSTTSIRSQSDARGAGARQPRCELTQHGGNLSGNPGVTTRHHRTGLDGIGPVPEQPGWFWAVQLEGFGPTRNRKVVGSNPTSGSKTAGQRPFLALCTARRQQAVIPLVGSSRRRRARPAALRRSAAHLPAGSGSDAGRRNVV
jgi:hypothetical protein